MQLRVYISVLLVQQDGAVIVIAKYGNNSFSWMVPIAKSSKLKICNADTVHPCICPMRVWCLTKVLKREVLSGGSCHEYPGLQTVKIKL